MKNKLIKMLEKHDWYFEMSDDHRYWVNGKRQLAEINEAMKDMNHSDAIDLWNEFCPVDFRRNK